MFRVGVFAGASIPVELHKKEKVFVPELIFGHLLTSSNYDDSVQRCRAVPRVFISAWAW